MEMKSDWTRLISHLSDAEEALIFKVEKPHKCIQPALTFYVRAECTD